MEFLYMYYNPPQFLCPNFDKKKENSIKKFPELLAQIQSNFL